MIYSMTGFGKGEASDGSGRIEIEIQSVNHRYADVAVKMPRRFAPIENNVKKYLQDRLLRGHIEARIRWEPANEGTPKEIKVDKSLAKKYYHALRDLSAELEIGEGVNLEAITRLPDVVRVEDAEDDLASVYELTTAALDQAIERLLKMQAGEGEVISLDIKGRLGDIKDKLSQISEYKGQVVSEYREKLTKRISELLEGKEALDESRLEMEVVLYADRSDITEEIVRFESHLHQFAKTLDEDETPGRRLDFIIQEMNREINTIGSKAGSYPVAERVITIKAELEKIREQVQNVK